MRNRVERLRIYLLGSALLLVLVISAFVVAARFLQHRLLANIPAKLGIDVVRETDGFTYSQSVQGRTLYRIHAAKAVERTDGKTALHDVWIVLYGRQGNRSDRISGDEFEYDKKGGIVRATGVVHMDLQAAATAGHPEKITHVTTSGLVYLQKLGVAATSAPIEFVSGGFTGHATGADYVSDSGMLSLHSAVRINGVQGGHPVDVNATSAQFDDRSQQALLRGATYRSDGRTASAEQATLYRREDGTLSRVEAAGNVSVEDKGSTVLAQRADVALTAASQPETAVLTGAVRYLSDKPLRQTRAEAGEARIAFDKQAKPQPQHAVFTGTVHIAEKTRRSVAAGDNWSTRDLTAATLVTELAPSGRGRFELRDAEATGSPRLVVVDRDKIANGRGPKTSELAADDLKAHLLASGSSGQPQLDTIAGRGHTLLREVSDRGVEQTSTADSLDAKFRPGVLWMKPADGKTLPGSIFQSALQDGHVAIVRRAPAGSKASAGARSEARSGSATEFDVQHAIAERAAYDGDRDRMTLTGGTQLIDDDSALWANQLTLDPATGDAHAQGAVKVSYPIPIAPGKAGVPQKPQQPADPAHVVADSVDMVRETKTAIFHGKPARMWQGPNQVQAPVIEFTKADKSMFAHAEPGHSEGKPQLPQVHTTLVAAQPPPEKSSSDSSANRAPPACAVPARGAAAQGRNANAPTASSTAVQLASGELRYSDALRQADFTGGVRADTLDGTIRAASASVYLRAAAGNAASSATTANTAADTRAPSLLGGVDHVVATGGIVLDRPSVRATGERLIYDTTARTALLTGTPEALPRAVTAQGTTSGVELRFLASCAAGGGGTVEVVGAPGQPVQTELRSAAQDRAEKGKR